jgi:hypothetical protein
MMDSVNHQHHAFMLMLVIMGRYPSGPFRLLESPKDGTSLYNLP